MQNLSEAYAAEARKRWMVTWVSGAHADRQAEAQDTASLLRLPIESPKAASAWLTDNPERQLLVVRRDGRPSVRPANAKPWVWHLGMAKSRIACVRRGEPDRLVRALALSPAHPVVFDGHLGLAHDALVVAASGARVIGAEIDPILAYITECGLRGLASASTEMRELVSRIEIYTGHHLDIMRETLGRWSMAMFSPMFISPDFKSPDMVAWRKLASHAPLSLEALRFAQSESERVVVKVLQDEIKHLPEPTSILEKHRRRLSYACYDQLSDSREE